MGHLHSPNLIRLCSELIVCSCTQIYCVIFLFTVCLYLVQNAVHFPIEPGMTELERWTKLVLNSNLVPMTSMHQGITNRSSTWVV